MGKKEISPEKLLDMIRGILPSTSRRYARHAKAAVNRAVRHRVHIALQVEDAEETKVDLEESAYLGDVVWHRRSGDKVNPFMRWCESWTRGMTEQQALDAVRALLPRNVIGDHAFGHWKQYLQYRRRRVNHWERGRRLEQSRYDKTRHRLRQALSADPGLQGRLNAAVKERKDEDEPRRMLLGVHDIDDYVRAVLNECRYCTEGRVLLGLLEEAERHGAHVECGNAAKRRCRCPLRQRRAAASGGWHAAGGSVLPSAAPASRRWTGRRAAGAPRNEIGTPVATLHAA